MGGIRDLEYKEENASNAESGRVASTRTLLGRVMHGLPHSIQGNLLTRSDAVQRRGSLRLLLAIFTLTLIVVDDEPTFYSTRAPIRHYGLSRGTHFGSSSQGAYGRQTHQVEEPVEEVEAEAEEGCCGGYTQCEWGEGMLYLNGNFAFSLLSIQCMAALVSDLHVRIVCN